METLTPLNETQEKQVVQANNAPLIHLSALSKFVIPFGSILGPLITWLIWRDQSKFDDFHGKEALNFNLSFIVYKIAVVILGLIMFLSPFLTLIHQNPDENPLAVILSIPGLLIFIGGLGILEIIWLILIIVAAIKAGHGEWYRYPMIIRFIK